MSVRLSDHFTLAEMTRSQTAIRRRLNNQPGPKHAGNLKTLCVAVLEPVREHFGRPVIISSGYRSPELNRAIGGASTSQHSKGEAADFTIPGVSNKAVCQWIRENLEFDQLIYEFGEAGWVHVSYREGRLRGQVLSAVRLESGTTYVEGLVP